jgi:hypothetical protein
LQPLQWTGFEVVSTHASPHLAKPARQLNSQRPAMHIGVPLGGASHATPQLPQFSASPVVSTQLTPSHDANPSSHAKEHSPSVQMPLPLTGMAHAVLQAPQ